MTVLIHNLKPLGFLNFLWYNPLTIDCKMHMLFFHEGADYLGTEHKKAYLL